MGWRGTLVLAAVVLAAGLYAYFDVTSRQPGASWRTLLEEPRPTPPGEQVKRLLSFDPAQVSTIRLRRNQLEAEVHRSASAWAGVRRPQTLDDFLDNLLEMAEVMPLDVGPEDLDDHGLDPPHGVIELLREDQPPIVLLLGHRNPPATGVYLQMGRDGPVVLTGALVLWEFDKAMKSLTEGN